LRGRLKRSTLLLWGYYIVLLVICLLLWIRLLRENPGGFGTIAWDYIANYTGPSMVVQGQGRLVYDLDAQTRWQTMLLYPRHAGAGLLPFRYPPTILPILLPFALVPLLPSYALWLAFSLAIALACCLLLQSHLRLDWQNRGTLLLAFLSFYPLSMHLWQGQTALLLLLGFTLAYVAWRGGMELWAGVALALCSVKPTLLILLLLVLLWKRRWRTLAGLAGGAAALALPTLPLVGLRGWWGFVELTVSSLGWNDIYGNFPVTMHNWRAFTLRLLGPGTAGTVLLAILSLLSLAALVWAWRGPWSPDQPRFPRQIALTLLLTLLTSPHLNLHDLVLWLLAGALIAYADPPPGPRGLRLALLLLGSLAPAISAVIGGPGGPPTVPLAAGMVVLLLAGLGQSLPTRQE